MKMITLRKWLLLLILSLGIVRQINAQQDTVFLKYSDFLGLVLENHPIAKQSVLRGQVGSIYLRSARGAFDPYLAANWDAKQFSGKNYWQLFEGSVRVPTWFGTELYAGWNSAVGSNLNPSQVLPTAGQAAIGLEVNLGRGLLMDQRRADLAKAKIYAEATLIDQRILLLDLITNASNAYWNWWLASQNRQTYQEALDLSNNLLMGLRTSYQRGENPAIDTLEAYIQVQNRAFSLGDAGIELLKAERTLNNFLWNPDGEPVEFGIPTLPTAETAETLPTTNFSDTVLDSMIASHPELLYYQYQQEQMEIEEKWRREQLKPELAIKYQALTAAPAGNEWLGNLQPANNLKWGVKFSFPILLRKQRANLALIRNSIQDLDFSQDIKAVELRNKISALQGQIAQTQSQIKLFEEMTVNYVKLVEAEIERFSIGESSIFLVNTREQKLLESELKLNDLRAKLPKLIAEANRVTGGALLP